MSVSRARRPPGRIRPTSSTSTPSSAPTTTSGRTRREPASASPSAPPGTAAPRRRGRSTRPTCSRSPRRCAATAPSRASTGRCSSGATRTRSPSRRRRRSSRCSCAHGVDVVVDADDGSTPTPVDLARDPHPQPRRRPRHGGRDRRHAVAQPAPGRRLQVQPAARRAGRHRRHRLDPARGQRAARGAACATSSARQDDERAVHRHDYVSAYVDDLPRSIDLDAIRDTGLRLGVDPLGGASVAYWEAIAERHGLDLTITNDQVDPTFRFVPARLGRQDPHGLLVALRDGAAARAGRPTSTSPSPTTPTPTATGSSRRAPGC